MGRLLLHWHCCGWLVALGSVWVYFPHAQFSSSCRCKNGTPALQLLLLVQWSSRGGGQCGLQNLSEKLSGPEWPLKQLTCVESAQCLSHSAESWQVSVHRVAMPDVWVNLQRRYGIRSKYRIAPRRQQYVKIFKLWGKLKGFGWLFLSLKYLRNFGGLDPIFWRV